MASSSLTQNFGTGRNQNHVSALEVAHVRTRVCNAKGAVNLKGIDVSLNFNRTREDDLKRVTGRNELLGSANRVFEGRSRESPFVINAWPTVEIVWDQSSRNRSCGTANRLLKCLFALCFGLGVDGDVLKVNHLANMIEGDGVDIQPKGQAYLVWVDLNGGGLGPCRSFIGRPSDPPPPEGRRIWIVRAKQFKRCGPQSVPWWRSPQSRLDHGSRGSAEVTPSPHDSPDLDRFEKK